MLKIIYAAIITTLAIGLILMSIVEYSRLPVVTFNQSGKCIYIDTEQGRQRCNLVPNKYKKQIVNSEDFYLETPQY